MNGDGASACTSTCTLDTCGDGYNGPGEGCDDGGSNGDGQASDCTDACQMTACGDGFNGISEACDDGANNDAEGQSNCRDVGGVCTLNVCGDNFQGLTEACDDGIDPINGNGTPNSCLLYTSPSPRDKRQSRMPSSA